MSDLPKIVLDRLRAAAPGETHPDADVLTAFAEQALSGTEREGVVRHLARCGDCREVVALSVPPSVETARPEPVEKEPAVPTVADRPRSWFAWPNLRWAAVAASVVVVGSVLLLHPGRETPSTHGYVNVASDTHAVTGNSSNTTGFPGAATKLEADARSEATDSAPATAPSTRARLSPPRPNRLPALEMRAGVKSDAPLQTENLLRRDQSGAAAVSVPSATAQENGQLAAHLGAVNGAVIGGPLAGAAPPAAAPAPAAEHPRVMNETVEVTAAAPTINTESAMVSSTPQPVTGNNGSGQAESLPVTGRSVSLLSAPIAKAKPAPMAKPAAKEQKEEAQAEGKLQTNDSVTDRKSTVGHSANDGLMVQKQGMMRSKDAVPRWNLAQGKLQRSLDSGTTWETALQLDRPLLSLAFNSGDVWVGGQSGTLFHTSDGGATWAMVQPSTKAGDLSADIVGIEVRSAAAVVLTTSNHESWTTSDGGKTWDKK